MKTIEVSSSVIRSLEYDEKARVLAINLHSGRVYRYANVFPDTVSDFASAASAGEFWRQRIQGVYTRI